MIKTYWIGRRPEMDIKINDGSISGMHAELVVGKDKRIFLNDCNSTNGTKIYIQNQWKELKQSYVLPSDIVLLGRYKVKVADLLSMTK